MENTNIIKQAKSDIFKELYTIIKFYIQKGAKPASLKKYYKNTKRFLDLIDDIKNKGINLVKDETEYKSLVRNILNEILDDFIAKEKDEEYKNKQKSKMKHIKEFNHFESENKINESNLMQTIHTLSTIGLGVTGFLFLKKLVKDVKKSLMTPQERYDKAVADIERINLNQFKSLIGMIRRRMKNKDCEIELTEDIVYYTIKFKYKDEHINYNYPVIIKLNKNDATLKFSLGDDDFTLPLKFTQQDIKELVDAIKYDIEHRDEILDDYTHVTVDLKNLKINMD